MVSPSIGAVVLVSFPFSDLSASKLRPAFVLSGGKRDDWLLCQITSNLYADSDAIEITDADIDGGSLQKISYARPGKLFTASASLLFEQTADSLQRAIVSAISDIESAGYRVSRVELERDDVLQPEDRGVEG